MDAYHVRDGGGGGGGRESGGSTALNDPEDREGRGPTPETMAMLRRLSPRHCAAASVLCNCCFNCCVRGESQGQCP